MDKARKCVKNARHRPHPEIQVVFIFFARATRSEKPNSGVWRYVRTVRAPREKRGTATSAPVAGGSRRMLGVALYRVLRVCQPPS